MSQYYLISQLPSLDAVDENSPIPITEKDFYDACEQCLDENAWNVMNKLSLVPDRDAETTGYKLVDEWNENERLLRIALGSIRANKMKKVFDIDSESIPPQQLQAARVAMESEDPLEAERLLNEFRMEILENLRPTDLFCDDAVFYYGLKLKLILRMRKFDKSRGEKAYRKIYDSIMQGEIQEAKQ